MSSKTIFSSNGNTIIVKDLVTFKDLSHKPHAHILDSRTKLLGSKEMNNNSRSNAWINLRMILQECNILSYGSMLCIHNVCKGMLFIFT